MVSASFLVQAFVVHGHRLARSPGHLWSRFAACVVVVCISTQGLDLANGNDVLVNIDWSKHAYSLERTDDQIAGPGADWIRDRAASCQFVLFGEQHGVAGLPEVVSAIYAQLHPQGFHHLIMERGPWVSTQLSNSGVASTLRQSPYAVAFDYDGEVQLLKTVESMFDGPGDAFWGVDQSLTGIHALGRLSQILPTYRARRAAKGLFLRDALQGGRFLGKDNSEDLAILRRLAGPDLGPESEMILDALEKSQSIFVAYHAKQRDERGIGISDIVREQYMMDQFDRYVAESSKLGTRAPKAILKMGGAHVMEGIGTNGVRTLGDHIQRTAEANGQDALHIAIRSYSDSSVWPPQVFSDASMTLIDMRSLRAAIPELPSDESLAGLERDITQYDAVLLLKDAGADSSREVQGYGADFRRGLLTGISIVLLPLLCAISVVVPLIRSFIQRFRQSQTTSPVAPWLLMAALATGWGWLVVYQVLRIRRWNTPELSQLSDSFWMTLVEASCVLIPVALCVLMVRKSWWSPLQRVHCIVISGGLIGLALFSHWWNLGRMLG